MKDGSPLTIAEGLRWIHGTQDQDNVAELEAALNLAGVYRAQRGLLADNDLVAQALRDS